MTDMKISASDGTGSFDAHVSLPAGGRGPGILVIQEIFGLNGFVRHICDHYATLGYLAVAPDLFWRLEPGVQLDSENPDDFQHGLDLMSRFDIDAAVDDMNATMKAMKDHDACSGKVGTVGYCLGGRLAYLMATRSGADASVSYYGVGIEALLDEAPAIANPLLLHLAEQDRFVPRAAQEQIRTGLSGIANVRVFSYPGADHAFARVGGDHYSEEAAELADQRTIAFFKEYLA